MVKSGFIPNPIPARGGSIKQVVGTAAARVMNVHNKVRSRGSTLSNNVAKGNKQRS